ncbi:type I 3-dehydroquinate dehydratase [Thermodesulfovibrio yellowstonii]|uniref:3-dehydroquinate dehydratase n=1 Tax=Thermodesulfovibrio yellowstonii TaxID=28262 RepID=A0A9W6LKI0_9BACT|nr:type I 3-dehydroquinate dehydratase [Thermodesulfovibrio islandicus]GLI52850.1 3-dehydroquinate dehydratase [Thermodesulfovibrio islandicus]
MFLQNIPAIAVVLNDKDVLSITKEELKGADLIELRVDMFEKTENISDIFEIAKRKYDLPLLCTVRLPEEGGKKEIKNRLDIYQTVLPFCSFFDMEIFSNEVSLLRQLVVKSNIILIGSYHNFSKTPSLEDLERVFERGKMLNMDIIKIATMVNEDKDLETLLFFTLRHKVDRIITLGMGQKGIPSRIINPVFGSMITYANFNEVSAPGQIHLKDMVHIFKVMKLRE